MIIGAVPRPNSNSDQVQVPSQRWQFTYYCVSVLLAHIIYIYIPELVTKKRDAAERAQRAHSGAALSPAAPRLTCTHARSQTQTRHTISGERTRQVVHCILCKAATPLSSRLLVRGVRARARKKLAPTPTRCACTCIHPPPTSPPPRGAACVCDKSPAHILSHHITVHVVRFALPYRGKRRCFTATAEQAAASSSAYNN